jgi:hypothetical protein
MDAFFYVQMGDGARQRLNRFDDKPVTAPTSPLNADTAQELIRLPAGKNVTLGQIGMTEVGGKNVTPDIVSSDETVVKVGRILRKFGREQSFEITTVGAGFATLSCRAGGALADAPPLGVAVGNFEKHTDMETDLIADAFNSGVVTTIAQLQRLLDNNTENLFNENTKANENHWGKLACGTVAKVGGGLFSSKTDYDDHYYPDRIRSVTSRSDVTYPAGIMTKAANAIQTKLQTGVPVLVGVVYSPSTAMLSGGELQVTRTGGHTVLIVGCDEDANKFLYIDPSRTPRI